MKNRPYAAATERNSAVILDVLREELRDCRSLLEIGSGTGQHAVAFGRELDHVEWQPSDVAENLDGIRAWIDGASLPNVADPLELDVCSARVPAARYDAVFSANTAHIMHFQTVEKMFALASGCLREEGVFLLYGPFRQDGAFNTASNEAFDSSLRDRDPGMGIRDLEQLDDTALVVGLRRERLYAMPANNYLALWRKPGAIQ